MAYDKHTWTCDEPITVERLNHIEDGIANAGGDCGFECEDGWVTLTEETITTKQDKVYDYSIASLSYTSFIDAEAIKVTFNGTEYECPRIVTSYGNAYGGIGQSGPDFSEYPFLILSNAARGNQIATENEGTYTVKIEDVEEIVTTTPCFDKARGYWCEEEIVTLTEESVTTAKGKDDDFAYGELAYSQFINADSITVTFDGVEYECPRIATEYGSWYGGVSQSDPDFSEYPFMVSSLSGLGNDLYTETTGTYTIKIEVEDTIAKTTPCFDLARGYSCDAKQMVIEESVTTQGDDTTGTFSNGSLIDAETIKVTFNGTEYECEQTTLDGGYVYGGFSLTPLPHPDFSQYPFVIMSRAGDGNFLGTEAAGTYAVKIEWTKETVTTTPCFEKAVKLVCGEVVYAKMERTVDEDGCTIYTLDITDEDLASIIRNGQQLVILEPTSKSGRTNYIMHYPTLVWVDGVSPALPIFQVGPGGVGDPVAMVTITMVDQFTLNERLLTLFAYSGTASPRYLEGKMCVSEDPLIVPLNKDISAATTSSLVKSLAPGVYNSIMNALNNGVSVYLREQSSKEMLLVTACNAGSGMTNATITVNIEETDGTLGITYSKPIKFHFDADGRCYYPMSAQ